MAALSVRISDKIPGGITVIIKCNIEDFDSTVKKVLLDWNRDLGIKINKKAESVSREAAKMLRKGGPYKERTRKYTRDWSSKLNPNGYRYTRGHYDVYTVYNKKNYRLTHLLENGHRIISHGHARGRTTKAFVHIRPVADFCETKMINEVEEVIKGGA